jgi:hypothetical protein
MSMSRTRRLVSLADGLRRGTAALLVFGALGSCAPERINAPASQGSAAGTVVCRVGPDGGPGLAERGIGGTGVNPQTTREAERGIGGTGIVGVITGFASVCLAGQEVALDDNVPVAMEGSAVAPAALRAGQVAAVDAVGNGVELRARSIHVRHEVSGPVEAREPDGMLRVAGQRVAITSATLGERSPAVGQWVAVSGLRRPDGVVLATRVDQRMPGPVTVHGQVQQDGNTLRLGSLRLRSQVPVVPGQYVTASGRYTNGTLYADTLSPDLLVTDPAAYFGPDTQHVLFEAYATEFGDRLRLGPSLEVMAPSGLGSAVPHRAVVELERSQGGTLRATGLRESTSPPVGPADRGMTPGSGSRTDPRSGASSPADRLGGTSGSAPGANRGYEPAPVPNSMPGLDGPDGGSFRGSPGGGRFGGPSSPGSDADRPGYGTTGPGSAVFGPGGMSAPSGGMGEPGGGRVR